MHFVFVGMVPYVCFTLVLILARTVNEVTHKVEAKTFGKPGIFLNHVQYL